MKISKQVLQVLSIIILLGILVYIAKVGFLKKEISAVPLNSSYVTQSFQNDSLKVIFPKEIEIKKEIVDCNSNALLPAGSKVLMTGGDGFGGGPGYSYRLQPSMTQVREPNTVEQSNLCATDFMPPLFTFTSFSKDEYTEVVKSQEQNAVAEVSSGEITIGNVTVQAKVFKTSEMISYHFNVNDAYYIVHKPLYTGNKEAMFDDAVLNSTIEFIFSHLEFKQS